MHVKEKHDSSFLLKWRLSKHQEIHDNMSLNKCHYFNNDNSGPLKKLDACSSMLCQATVNTGKSAQNLFALSSMVKNVKYERFISRKRQIHCYFCKYVSKCKALINIQEKVNNHLKTDHSQIVDTYDPDNFESDSDYWQEFLVFFVL